MKYISFYEGLIIFFSASLVLIALAAIIIKYKYNQYYYWQKSARSKLILEINALSEIDDQAVLEQQTSILTDKYKELAKRKRGYDLLELFFFYIAARKTMQADIIQRIACELDFPEQSIRNLKSHSKTRILRGCRQAGAYKYRPAVPYMLDLLKQRQTYLQYDVLKALARFDDPRIIISAFEIIHNRFVVNERIVCEIVNWLSAENQEILFKEILTMDSDYLRTVFLDHAGNKSVAAHQDKVILLFCADQSKELRRNGERHSI